MSEPNASNSTNGLYNFKQRLDALDESEAEASRRSSDGDAVQHIAGIVGNQLDKSIWNATRKEQDDRSGFYNATNAVDIYFKQNLIEDKVLQNGQGRADLTNFITDGTLPTSGINTKDLSKSQLEYNLRVIYTGSQILLTERIKVKPGLDKILYELNEAYKKAGGKARFDKASDYINNNK